MKKRLIIVGAGDLGIELFYWIQSDLGRTYEPFGYLDDTQDSDERLQKSGISIPVVGRIRSYTPTNSEVFICAIADPRGKMEVSKMLKEKGAEFVNFIHSSVIISANVEFGKGIIICPNVVVSNNARIGNFVTINIGTTIGHDATIEDGCTLSSHCDITGHVTLKTGVFLGTHVATKPGVLIGEYASVGMSSAVVANVKPNRSVFGVPAKELMTPAMQRG
jgi:sugar O-acyltransferase (sialic acid O-acetyltransferase NeuD family)